MNELFNIIINKLPRDEKDILPINGRKIVTFLNPYSFYQAISLKGIYPEFDFIAFDGIFPILILKLLYRKVSTMRLSFDMTSVGKSLLEYCEDNSLSVYFLGSTQKDIEKFYLVIKKEYSSLNIVGYHNGYIKGKEDKVLKNIIDLNPGPDVIIVGMGSPLQDIIAVKIKSLNFRGSIYTCGGFFHQTTDNIKYYPDWVNTLNLRFFYRLYKEPHVFKRGFKNYPSFFLDFSKFLILKRLKNNH